MAHGSTRSSFIAEDRGIWSAALEEASRGAGGKRIRLYIAEEQQMLKEAYQAFFSPQPDMEVIGASGDTSADALLKAADSLRPNVMLLGIKILHPTTVEKLEAVRESCPNMALIVLSAYYDINGIKSLREFSRGASVGCAYLLKHTIDTVDQLTQVVHAVAEGRIILDPAIMEGLIAMTDPKATFLKELTPRELEVLGWMRKATATKPSRMCSALSPRR